MHSVYISINPNTDLNEMQRTAYYCRKATYESKFIWSDALKPIWDACIVHMSPNVPGKIAYFSSIENVIKNRTTQTSPEMFLDRYLEYAPIELKIAWETEVLGKTIPEIKFVSNTAPEEWKRIYHDGPRSCMKGHNIVKNYAHPKNNLALAYMEIDGKIQFRTIVNTKYKTYLRIYSQIDAEGNRIDSTLMAAGLAKLGYEKDNKTLAEEIIYIDYYECETCNKDTPVGPYLDGEYKHVAISEKTPLEGIISDDGYNIYHDGDVYCANCRNE